MSELKIGVIGTGHLGKIHTKLWKENKSAHLTGIFDADSEKAKSIADEFNITAFNSINELLENVDAVTISSPTSTHFEIAELCINKGVHCFIEKPITSKYFEAERLISLAENKNIIIQVGHVERFNPAISAASKYNLEPRFIETHRLSQFKPRATDVSVVHDLMIHDIDILLNLVKSPLKSVDANGVNVLTETTDIANARLTFENGAVANITASRITAKPMRKMRIFQKDMYLSIDFSIPELEVFKILNDNEHISDGSPATMLGSINQGTQNKNIYYLKPKITQVNAISEEQYAFSDSITKGNPVSVKADEAAQALLVAEIIDKKINS